MGMAIDTGSFGKVPSTVVDITSIVEQPSVYAEQNPLG